MEATGVLDDSEAQQIKKFQTRVNKLQHESEEKGKNKCGKRLFFLPFVQKNLLKTKKDNRFLL